VLKPIDGQAVWSIVCFFVSGQHRRKGISVKLIRAALDFVRSQGGAIVEAYPGVTRPGKVAPSTAYMGFPGVFAAAGFVEAARPSATRRIMRHYTADARPASEQPG
jgi:GNAT superfamily N-acetyltransferase